MKILVRAAGPFGEGRSSYLNRDSVRDYLWPKSRTGSVQDAAQCGHDLCGAWARGVLLRDDGETGQWSKAGVALAQ